MSSQALVLPPAARELVLPTALATAIATWADTSTDAGSERRHDLLRDKRHAVSAFFGRVGKTPDQVTPADVSAWEAELIERGLAPATVYAMVSRISSFYNWAHQDPELGRHLGNNPVKLARPKAPKAYQTESTKALDDDEVEQLLAVVKAKAATGDVVGKRDYALLLLYFLTGMRREEVMRLRWGDVKLKAGLVITAKVKGGSYVARELREPEAEKALVDYLQASSRYKTLTRDTPLWTRHDRAGTPGGRLTSHAFAKNLKAYAREAGLGDIHLHQTRHTYARIVADESGSLTDTQEALGHKNRATTLVYVQRVGIKKDLWGGRVAERLKIGDAGRKRKR